MTPLRIEYLPWDSEFFGSRIGELTGNESANIHLFICKGIAHDYKCLYSLIDCHDHNMSSALARSGFSLVDVRIELAREVTAPLKVNLKYDLRLGARKDVECLAFASQGTFTNSRFYSDPYFPRERCHQLYNEWIHRDCTTKDRFMVIAESRGRLAGFWSASIKDGVGQTGLGFVDPLFRGMGVPVAMMNYMSEQLEACGVNTLNAATQGSNVAAVKMHLNCGFKFSGTKLWYHGHL